MWQNNWKKPVSIPRVIRNGNSDLTVGSIGIVTSVYGHEMPPMVLLMVDNWLPGFDMDEQKANDQILKNFIKIIDNVSE